MSLRLRENGYTMTERIAECIDRPHIPQRSTEWFELRSRCITGSIADTIVGNNTFFGSYEQLILEKAGKPQSFTGNAATRHGQHYEPVAINEYMRRTNRHVVELGLIPHATIDILSHSPDGISLSKTGPPVLLEIKCPMSRKIKSGVVPKYYMAQLQLGMEVFDLEEAHFVQYQPDPLVFDLTCVKRDPNFMAESMPKFEKFWADVLLWRSVGWTNHPTAVHENSMKVFNKRCVVAS